MLKSANYYSLLLNLPVIVKVLDLYRLKDTQHLCSNLNIKSEQDESWAKKDNISLTINFEQQIEKQKGKEVSPIQLQTGHLLSKYIFIDILGKAFSRDKVEKLLKMLSKNTHILMKENSKIIEMLTVSLSFFPQFHKVVKKISHKSERAEYSAIGRWNDSWVVGGKDRYSHQITVLNKNLKVEAKHQIPHPIYCMIIVQDLACLGCQHGLQLLDLKTSAFVELQKSEQPIRTILQDQSNQSIIVSVSGNGIFQVVNLKTKALLYRVKVCDKVKCMVSTTTPNEYAFATNKGVIIGTLDPQQSYKFTKNNAETYFADKAIGFMAQIDGMFLVITSHTGQVVDDSSWGWSNTTIYTATLINRETKKEIQFSDGVSEVYSAQQVKGCNGLLMLQMYSLCLLDIENLKVTHLCSNSLGFHDRDLTSTFCQVDNGNGLQIGMVSFDQKVSAVKICSFKY
ncbi:UNKNOWN [Stylonychia lemnae]|uniref:Uncharacterized protein n=1 Tax=Stylonychia lemnae TaxID=5949 RepID=A0A078AB43_STYLE|nr:UNKNOWN [Stylonychia lemnae]|eukprot:CDW78827.1 UNKNOWN [Stylonychia lemnae]